ncbi:MAG: YhdP family protein [Pseudomonadota bacterium]
MNPIRRLILRVRAFIWTAFAMVCIGLALLVGIANLLLPYADRYRNEVADVLAQRLGKPVSLERLEGEWAAFGPRFTLHGLALGDPTDGDYLRIDLAAVTLDFVGALRPGRGMQQLKVTVDEVEVVRRSDGSWGLGRNDATPGGVRSDGIPLDWLDNRMVAALSAGRIVLHDARSGLTARLPGGTLTVDSHDGHAHLLGRFGTRTTGVVEAVLEHAPDSDRLRLYVAGDGINLPSWSEDLFAGLAVSAGESRFRLWFDLRETTLKGDFETTGLELRSTDQNPVQGVYRLDTLGGDVSGWVQPDDLGLVLSDLTLARSGHIWQAEQLGVGWQAGRLRLQARHVEVEDLFDAAILLPALPVDWRRRLATASARGTVEDLDLAIALPDTAPLEITGHLDLTDASWEPIGRAPGATRVRASGQFTGRTASGEFGVDGGRVELPWMFRNAFTPMELATTWSTDWAGAVPTFSIETQALRNAGVEAEVRAELQFNGGRPFVDLSANVIEGDVAVAHRYLPVNVTPPPVVAWLDRALIAGTLDNGRVALFGDLDEWPFRNAEGRFSARAHVAAGRLDYQDDWPPLTAFDADLEFDPFGMRARINSAELAGMQIGESDLDLSRFKEPLLKIAAQGRSSGEAALAFLRDMPIEGGHREYLEGLTLASDSDVWTNIDIPLNPRLGTTRVRGHAWLESAQIVDSKWDVAFDDTTGRVDFSETGVEAVELDTVFRGSEAKLSLRTGEFVNDTNNAAEAELTAESTPDILLTDIAPFAPLLPHIVGPAPWRIEVGIPTDGSGARFMLACELDAEDLDLPAPIGGADERTVELSFNLEDPLQRLDVTLGNVGTLRARRPDDRSPWSAFLALGDALPQEPSAQGLTVAGSLPTVDLDSWMGIFSNFANPQDIEATEQTVLDSLDLTVDQLRLAGRDFAEVRVQARRDESFWTVALDGESVAGRLRLPTTLTENRLLLAEFERLDWPAAPDGASGIRTEFDPRVLPPMDFFANELSFAGSPLGVVRFESFPTATGMRIETFTTESPELRVTAGGDWFADRHSAFNVTVTAPNVGRVLENFGFTGIIEGGQLLAQIDAEWDGSPSDFELKRLDGALELDVRRGMISEVEPGAGRVFGLLSVQTLPRRLLLDFSDLFSSGLAFDSITGQFELDDGEAHTGDLIIEGPTADVLIQGRTGLAERDYDQVVTVVPKIGGSLPLVGALAGGGVGAAALLVLQGVLGDEINELSKYQYAVQGPWSDPAITRLERDPRDFVGAEGNQSGE